MCVIVMNSKGSRKLTEAEFNQCWRRNPHGYGIMYVVDSVVISKKTMELPSAFELYNQVMDLNTWNVVSHFRFATHGSVGIANTHPFDCGLDDSGGNMMLVHNGVLGYSSKLEPDKSDTRLLCDILKRFPRGYTKLQEYNDAINKQLSWDKILIMDSSGNVSHYGAAGVAVDDGIWASNNAPITYNKPNTMIDLGRETKSNSKKMVLGEFYGIPSIKDESEDAYFYNGILYGDEFLVNRKWYVEEYSEREDITV